MAIVQASLALLRREGIALSWPGAWGLKPEVFANPHKISRRRDYLVAEACAQTTRAQAIGICKAQRPCERARFGIAAFACREKSMPSPNAIDTNRIYTLERPSKRAKQSAAPQPQRLRRIPEA
jgi:hypothetical protein